MKKKLTNARYPAIITIAVAVILCAVISVIVIMNSEDPAGVPVSTNSPSSPAASELSPTDTPGPGGSASPRPTAAVSKEPEPTFFERPYYIEGIITETEPLIKIAGKRVLKDYDSIEEYYEKHGSLSSLRKSSGSHATLHILYEQFKNNYLYVVCNSRDFESEEFAAGDKVQVFYEGMESGMESGSILSSSDITYIYDVTEIKVTGVATEEEFTSLMKGFKISAFIVGPGISTPTPHQ